VKINYIHTLLDNSSIINKIKLTIKENLHPNESNDKKLSEDLILSNIITGISVSKKETRSGERAET
jgi:hypothetical protein